MKGGIVLYKALELAKYVVSKCIQDDNPISNLQLQKILFYIQRDYLQNENRAAFADEIEAWRFGPVVPNTYYNFWNYGAMPITVKEEVNIRLTPHDKKKIDGIIEDKRNLNPWELVRDTHKNGGSWMKTYQDGLGDRRIIEKEDIRKLG